MTHRSTKNHLIRSCFALLLCFSMLIGTTFAWFTDSVTSSGNKITSGSLKVDLELLDPDTNLWNSVKESKTPIFTYNNWEPGYVDVKVLKIENEGSLAFKWKAMFVSEAELSDLADVIDVYVLTSESEIGYPTDRSLNGYKRVGTVAEFVNTIEETTYGNLLAGEVAYLGIALKMQETAGNEYQDKTLGEFDIRIVATQMANESDSFGPDYDKNVPFPGEFVASAPVSIENGAVSAETTVGNDDGIHATVPTGVKMADGATELTLSVKTMKESEANITLSKDESVQSIDVHMDGISEDNTVPMLITLEGLFSAGLNTTSVKMYHVENGVTVEMTQVANPTNHNEFSYDPGTGNVVMAVASFSEYVTVEDNWNPWAGMADISWYNDTDTEFTINSADQLAGLGMLVDGGNDFAGKTVRLGTDINLYGTDENGNRLSFNPIGFKYPGATDDAGNDIAKIFRGTFDGDGHTVKNLYQNGWELGLSYSNAGAGLFAGVQNATIKNLTMEGANIVMEAVPMGTVAAYAYGECTFENIHVNHSTLQNYNWDIAAIVGGVNGKHTFNNIYIDNTVTLSSLWGSFGGGIGGVIGSVYGGNNGNNAITMTNVDVACVMDVYNDVTSAYQWYAYRFCGMLIGNSNEPGADGKNAYVAAASYLTCENVNVYYGDWINYHYCQFTNQSNESGSVDWQNNYPWVRVEAGLSNPGYSNARYGHPVVDGAVISNDNHTHADGDEHDILIAFNQLYGGDQGVYGQEAHAGVTVHYYKYTVTYMDGSKIESIEYVTDNSKAHTPKALDSSMQWLNEDVEVVTSIPAGNIKNIVLYKDKDLKDVYVAYFVDINGTVIYSEEFRRGQSALTKEPTVPEISGYTGAWESYNLKNAEGSIVIKPMYSIASGYEELLQGMTAEQMFQYLEEGKNIIMSSNLASDPGKLNGGTAGFCVLGRGISSSLNINAYELTCIFSHSANNDWYVFDLNSGSTLTITSGIKGEGLLKMKLEKMNSNASACLFNLQSGSTLVLKAGVVIEVHYPTANNGKVTAFSTNVDTSNYPGLMVDTTTSGVIRITVTEDTIITAK